MGMKTSINAKIQFIIATTVALIVVVLILLVFMLRNHTTQSSANSNCWAIYNCGQEIEGSEGVEGVDINIVDAWELCPESSNVIVGIVDSGIDSSCTRLTDCLWVNSNEIPDNGIDDDGNGYIDDAYGWDFYNQDGTIYDDYLYDYHGTYIANMIETVAPGVKLISSKFLKGTQGDASDAVDAIAYAIENGAEIINCSWCFSEDEPELLQLMAANTDVLFVCAAGNSHLNLDVSTVYPASYELDNVISVMAIDNTGTIYELSGYGEAVDIAAPGKDIWVELPEGDSTYVSGTSIATAFVTGAAALLKSCDSSLTASELRSILINTANTSESLQGLCASNGYLDVYSAVTFCLNQK